jgi:hypothetical protein
VQTNTKEIRTMSWKDPYKKIREAEASDRDYNEGFSDGDYNKRYQQACMRPVEKESAAYRKGFKDACGYTPKEWRAL